MSRGEFRPRDARLAALSVIGMCNWVAWWFHPGPSHPAEPVADQLAQNAVDMLAGQQRILASIEALGGQVEIIADSPTNCSLPPNPALKQPDCTPHHTARCTPPQAGPRAALGAPAVLPGPGIRGLVRATITFPDDFT